jgi:hypothetical protein
VPPRLAREAVTAAALRGDTAALLSASAYLPAREAFRYDRRRAAAFATALAGERALALSELGLGGGVRSLRLGLDTAVVELLTRGATPAIEAVALALRDGFHSEPDVPLILGECVRRDPETARAALGVAVRGGTPLDRARAAAAVVGAARFGPLEAAVPALAVVSLALAVVAFLRLPGLIAGDETATPRLREPRPTVVVPRPRERQAEAPPARATRPRRPEPEAIGVTFRPGTTSAPSASSRPSRDTGTTRARNVPRPTPAPPAPATVGSPSPAAPAAQPMPAPVAGGVAGVAVVSPPEITRQPAVAPPVRRAERKAAKAEEKAAAAERRAERKAAKDSARIAAAAPVPAAVAPSEADASTAAAEEALRSADAEHGKPNKPDKSAKLGQPDDAD